MKKPASPNGKDFWRPPGWKWVVVFLLLVCSAVLFFRKPVSRPVRVELLPFTDSPPAWNGSYPYVVISPADGGSGRVRFRSSISFLAPTLRHETPVNEFRVDLHSGRFSLNQTDLFVPDVMPLSLTRTYVAWDPHVKAFGIGTNHPYDICPTGSRFPYTYMDLNLEDGHTVHMPRISKGTGYADAVFRHGATSSEFYGAQVAWNGNGWTLKLRDGHQVFFPESYSAKNCAQGAPVAVQDAEAHRIELRRDNLRNLQQLISPSGYMIDFKYDDQSRVVQATDNSGRTRKYTYSYGHLESLSDGVHTLYEFEYQILLKAAGYDSYLMTSIKDGNGKELLRNWYSDGGRVSMQRVGDGEVYRYDYLFDKRGAIVETMVTLPGGKEKRFFFESGVMVKEK